MLKKQDDRIKHARSHPPTRVRVIEWARSMSPPVNATNFLLGPDVSFRGEAEVGREAEPAASVETDPLYGPAVRSKKISTSCR